MLMPRGDRDIPQFSIGKSFAGRMTIHWAKNKGWPAALSDDLWIEPTFKKSG
jgi:hypothetical protein